MCTYVYCGLSLIMLILRFCWCVVQCNGVSLGVSEAICSVRTVLGVKTTGTMPATPLLCTPRTFLRHDITTIQQGVHHQIFAGSKERPLVGIGWH